MIAVARTGVLKLVPKAHLRHTLRSRDHMSSAGVFIRSFIPHLLFLLVRQYTPISNDFIRSRFRVIIAFTIT
jgi:hypothetical protein